MPGDRGNFDAGMSEAYPALAELREQGVIKAIGLGMNQWQMLADFARAGDFDAFLLAGRELQVPEECSKIFALNFHSKLYFSKISPLD